MGYKDGDMMMIDSAWVNINIVDRSLDGKGIQVEGTQMTEVYTIRDQ